MDAAICGAVHEIVIRQACCLHFGTLENDFGSLGAPREAKGAAEGAPWVPESEFQRFGVDDGTPF